MCDCCDFSGAGLPVTPIDFNPETEDGITYVRQPDGSVSLVFFNGKTGAEFASRAYYCTICGRDFV